MERRPRIAAVGYTNAWPLTTRIDRIRFEVVEDHPSEVARMLRAGEAEVGLVPVAALLDGADWRIVPGQAIGCDGAVGSVVLASEQPPERWQRVLLDGASRSSAMLARLLLGAGPLGRRTGAVEILEVEPGSACSRAAGPQAALVIGDEARHLPPRLRHVVDLGAEWKAWTGLAFVYAVWAGRPSMDPELVATLRRAAAEGLALRSALPQAEARYLTEQVRYELDDRALAGLRRFAAMARERGMVPSRDLPLYAPPARLRPRPDVDTLLARGAEGERLGSGDALRLHLHAPLVDLGVAADLRRQALHPSGQVTYIVSRNVNYTNVCVTGCRFCAFHRPSSHPQAYVLTREELAAKCRELLDVGGVELLLQGGLHPGLGLSWYEDLFRFVKRRFRLDLHALSPEELLHISRLSGQPLERVIERLHEAGLDSIPGGGAEILVDEVRRRVSPRKCSAADWLRVMETAHRLGIRSSATMMFGMGERPEHRVEHLLRLRELQDRSGGFVAFIAWTFQPGGTRLRPGDDTAADYLRVVGLARLVLDCFQNLQASWVTQGPEVAQAALRMGCNDFGSVMLEENVVSAAGTTWRLGVDEVEHQIREAGFVPARRDAAYRRLPVVGPAGTRHDPADAAPAS